MKNIGMFEAKTHLPAIIKRVESGEEICLTNRNQPVAMLIPIELYKQKNKEEFFKRLWDLKKKHPIGTPEEIISMRDEGRK